MHKSKSAKNIFILLDYFLFINAPEFVDISFETFFFYFIFGKYAPLGVKHHAFSLFSIIRVKTVCVRENVFSEM